MSKKIFIAITLISFINLAGSIENQSKDGKNFILNQRESNEQYKNNVTNSSDNLILGYSNTIKETNYSFIVGDSHNLENNCDATVMGRLNDVKKSNFSLVSGYQNIVSESERSHVSGNTNNVSKSSGALVNGYGNNVLQSNYSQVNGYKNEVSESETSHVSGNRNNVSKSGGALVNGYRNNVLQSVYSLVNGYQNSVLQSNYSQVNGYKNKVTESEISHVSGNKNTVLSSNYALVNGVGNNVSKSGYSFVNGSESVVSNSEYGVALGYKAKVIDSSHSLAMGSWSETRKVSGNGFLTNQSSSNVYSFSVGNGKNDEGKVVLRRIQGLADGKELDEAVTVAQLKVVDDKVNNIMSGVSNAVAMANLPQVMGDKKFNLAASYGYYGGSHAVAVGFSGTNDKQNFIYKLSGSVNNKGNLAFGIGAGVMLGEVNNKDKKIENLEKTNKELLERVAKLEKLLSK